MVYKCDCSSDERNMPIEARKSAIRVFGEIGEINSLIKDEVGFRKAGGELVHIDSTRATEG